MTNPYFCVIHDEITHYDTEAMTKPCLCLFLFIKMFMCSVNNNMIHHDNVADITNADPRPGQDGAAYITLKLASWNCHGLKSNMQ